MLMGWVWLFPQFDWSHWKWNTKAQISAPTILSWTTKEKGEIVKMQRLLLSPICSLFSVSTPNLTLRKSHPKMLTEKTLWNSLIPLEIKTSKHILIMILLITTPISISYIEYEKFWLQVLTLIQFLIEWTQLYVR